MGKVQAALRVVMVATALVSVIVAGVAATAMPVAAHPLGNFSVNRYSLLEVGDDRLVVHYVLDMAEIPTFQELQAIDANRDGAVDDAELAAFSAQRATTIVSDLRLTIDGTDVPLAVDSQRLAFPDGQGGLKTLRLEMSLAAPLVANNAVKLAYTDLNEPERPGWREIVAVPAVGRALRDATVPVTDVSAGLTTYPDDMLTSPLNVRSATVTAIPAAGTVNNTTGIRGQPDRARDAFAALISTEMLTPPAIAIALLIAFGLGAVHALSPGHGKAVVAGYLVGARGTARHAVALGVTVTVTHTAGVFALGLVTLLLSQYILPERLFPWLSATSGLLIVVIGLSLARVRLADLLRGRRIGSGKAALHVASIGRHRHTVGTWHAHGVASVQPSAVAAVHRHGWFDTTHDHGPGGHSHAPMERLSWRGLIALGISGGLIPCPSALVVLLGAIALQRVGFGMLLIVAFSAGLAAVLTGIGLVLVLAGRLFSRLPNDNGYLRLLPVGSALLVTCAGLVLMAQALVEAGVIRP